MVRILTVCKFCRSEVISTEEWFLSNKLLFCHTCCKSFTPEGYQRLDPDTTKPRYDNEEFKETLVNDYIETDDWSIYMEEE